MKICLIGSTRFIEKYQEINAKLTLAGHIVYTVALLTSEVRSAEITPEQKETLDLVHLRKILESDMVFLITDESRYVGESTRRELKWAQIFQKSILTDMDLRWLEFGFLSAEDLFNRGNSLNQQSALNQA